MVNIDDDAPSTRQWCVPELSSSSTPAHRFRWPRKISGGWILLVLSPWFSTKGSWNDVYLHNIQSPSLAFLWHKPRLWEEDLSSEIRGRVCQLVAQETYVQKFTRDHLGDRRLWKRKIVIGRWLPARGPFAVRHSSRAVACRNESRLLELELYGPARIQLLITIISSHFKSARLVLNYHGLGAFFYNLAIYIVLVHDGPLG